MIVRMLRESDVPRLKRIYKKMGIPLPFPNLKEFFPMPVIVDEQNRVVMGVGMIPTVEVWLFVDKKWETPGMRQEAFRVLHERVRKDLRSRGIVQAHAFLPPDMEKQFGRRLTKLFGWIKESWPCFFRRTDHV